VVNDVQAATPAAWRFARRLLAGLRGAEAAAHGASVDAFAGAYRRGAFGVHKDDQDVVTIVLEGRKRFRLWPYARFADRPEVPAGSELAQVGLTLAAGEEPPARLGVEGQPGDVFYWPAEWWHVAESDGDLCATLGVGLFRTPRPAPADPERAEEHAVAHAAAFGCHLAPPPAGAPLRLDVPARAARGAVVVRMARDGSVLWGVGGEAFRYPAARAIVALLHHVAAGAPFVPAALIERLADDEVAPDALAHILETLHAHHGLLAPKAPQRLISATSSMKNRVAGPL
jgi:hypothetical protein